MSQKPPCDIITSETEDCESQIPSQGKAVTFLTNRIKMAQWVKLQRVSALSKNRYRTV